MSSNDLLEHLTPDDFIEEALQKSLRKFLVAYGDTQLLLVKLDDPTGELSVGLAATMIRTDTRIKPSLNALAYDTHVLSNLESGDDSERRVFDEDRLRAVVMAAPYFVAPLRKRALREATHMERICVGRARNQDLVLRNRNVSKFHGWLESDESGTFYVVDGGSRNGTRVNGKRIEPHKLHRLQAGDQLHFGTIEAVICPAETFWNLLHAED